MGKLIIFLLFVAVVLALKEAYTSGFEAGVNYSIGVIDHAEQNDPERDKYGL